MSDEAIRQCIKTDFETDDNGNRFVMARAADRRFPWVWDDHEDIQTNHRRAARAALRTLGWDQQGRWTLRTGAYRHSYFHVLVPAQPFARTRAAFGKKEVLE